MISRRQAITSTPAALAIAIGAGAVAHEETPVQRLFSKWAKERGASLDKSLPDDEREVAGDNMTDVEQKLWDTPSESPQDVLLKIWANTVGGNFGIDAEENAPLLWQEFREYANIPA